MDILAKLDRILGETTTHTHSVTAPRKLVADAATEIRRLRAINAGLVRQLNGEPPEPHAPEP